MQKKKRKKKRKLGSKLNAMQSIKPNEHKVKKNKQNKTKQSKKRSDCIKQSVQITYPILGQTGRAGVTCAACAPCGCGGNSSENFGMESLVFLIILDRFACTSFNSKYTKNKE